MPARLPGGDQWNARHRPQGLHLTMDIQVSWYVQMVLHLSTMEDPGLRHEPQR